LPRSSRTFRTQSIACTSRHPCFLLAGGYHEGHGTCYEAIGTPISACGIPAEMYIDENGKALPFGALNTNSMFEDGKNCGRWVEVTLGQNCGGSGNSQWAACNGGSARPLLPTACCALALSPAAFHAFTSLHSAVAAARAAAVRCAAAACPSSGPRVTSTLSSLILTSLLRACSVGSR
jgi:hypothetical protein